MPEKGKVGFNQMKVFSVNKYSLIFGVTLFALVLTACSVSAGENNLQQLSADEKPVSAEAPVQDSYSDPFAYCAAVGQIDSPDQRYSGPTMPDELFQGYLKSAGLNPNTDYPESFKQMTIWRCMDHKVYACNFGANIPCDSKANTEKIPTQAMAEFCKQFPDESFIPMSVTGHNVIYSWHCVKGQPELLEQIDTVDAGGYQSSFWQLVESGQ
jgi:hypothetical protein